MPSTPRPRGASRAFATCRRGAGALVLVLCAGCGVRSWPGAPAAPPPRDTGSGPAGPVTPHSSGTLVTIHNVRSFQVVEEKDTSSFRMPHQVFGWTKIHLSFTTTDGRVNVALTDNGAALTVNVRTSTECASFSSYYQYGEREDESHLYDAMEDAFSHLVRVCSRGMETAGQYRRQLRRARADFKPAMQAMKTRVSAVFRRTERCENPADPNDFDAREELASRCIYD
jgi:hypothetical protein